MFNKFRKDPNYLTKYHLIIAASLFLANCMLFYFKTPSAASLLWYLPALYLMTSTELKLVMTATAYSWVVGTFQTDFSPLHMLALVPAILFTFPLTSWLHSASHVSLRPRWLNRPLGELTGIMQLSGFADWRVLHVIHHQFPDNPEYDPHHPGQRSYWKFAFGMRAMVGQSLMNYYFKLFGRNEVSFKRIKYLMLSMKIDSSMKVIFWFMLLGPQYFSYLFTSSILFKMLHYAWFNWATHRPDKNGKYEIINLDHSFYRVINFLAAGLYYHGNHHLNPNLHNPKYVKVAKPAFETAEPLQESVA